LCISPARGCWRTNLYTRVAKRRVHTPVQYWRPYK
jgi:hypothetical protein